MDSLGGEKKIGSLEKRHGIKPNTIRLSIGIERVEDLIAALDAAFEAVK